MGPVRSGTKAESIFETSPITLHQFVHFGEARAIRAKPNRCSCAAPRGEYVARLRLYASVEWPSNVPGQRPAKAGSHFLAVRKRYGAALFLDRDVWLMYELFGS
jgi:hypothetical protein